MKAIGSTAGLVKHYIKLRICCYDVSWNDVKAKFNLDWEVFAKAAVSVASDFAEGAPLFGHFIGFAYYNLKKPEKCKQAMISATRTLGKVNILGVVELCGDCRDTSTNQGS